MEEFADFEPRQKPMTCYERDLSERLTKLEGVVARMTQAVYPTTTGTITLGSRWGDITALENANAALRAEIEEKDEEIVRLTDLVHAQDKRLDEYHDAVIGVREAIEGLGEGW
jgi:hypothetical protein